MATVWRDTAASDLGILFITGVGSIGQDKMIATIDPNKPIWDQYVLQNLGLELKGKNPQERVENAILIYDRIEKWYKDYLATEEARRNIDEFDRWLPSYSWIPEIKKIDYLLWSRREEKSE